MTEHKLLKYLSKTVELPEGDKHLTPVVLTFLEFPPYSIKIKS
jgi:hypothetical protein